MGIDAGCNALNSDSAYSSRAAWHAAPPDTQSQSSRKDFYNPNIVSQFDQVLHAEEVVTVMTRREASGKIVGMEEHQSTGLDWLTPGY